LVRHFSLHSSQQASTALPIVLGLTLSSVHHHRHNLVTPLFHCARAWEIQGPARSSSSPASTVTVVSRGSANKDGETKTRLLPTHQVPTTLLSPIQRLPRPFSGILAHSAASSPVQRHSRPFSGSLAHSAAPSPIQRHPSPFSGTLARSAAPLPIQRHPRPFSGTPARSAAHNNINNEVRQLGRTGLTSSQTFLLSAQRQTQIHFTAANQKRCLIQFQ
jgi:hypothetical protein